MRLIDADAMRENLIWCKEQSGSYDSYWDDVIERLDAQPTVGGWISVKDRLPEKTERYMCLCYDFVTKSYWYELLWHENNCWWNSLVTLECNYTKHVVYWMPLPEPPKEPEND